MSEFDLIRQHFTRATHHTNLGIGDDAALISIGRSMELAISADMLVAGTHFFEDVAPYQLGWKSLAVNLSDMAAMGANPKWATLAIALPQADSDWLSQFSSGFFACASAFSIDLIGGDTTRGPLTISIQIMGEVPTGQAIKRSGANIDDEIWISGELGDAALALAAMQGRIQIKTDDLLASRVRLESPQPRVALGLALCNLATSAIDISDGLMADLGHILKQSDVGAEIEVDKIPRSEIVDSYLPSELIQAIMLSGGDDYELCFTAPPLAHHAIIEIGQQLNLKLTSVGVITDTKKLLAYDANKNIVPLDKLGYNHFDA